MINSTFLIVVSALVSFVAGKDASLSEVRKLYRSVSTDETSCNGLIQLIDGSGKVTPVLLGYKACATMAMANHTYNPISKLSYFNEGKSALEKQIAANGKEYELRYLRLTVQTNAPSFLGYSGSIESDKKFLKDGVNSIKDTELKKMISEYLKSIQ